MDKKAIAKDLVAMVRELTALDPKAILKDLKSIQILRAEGDMKAGLPTLEGKKFPTVQAFEKALSRFDKPDMGYDKCNMLLTFKDGSQLQNFRYDHGEKDPSFSEQLNWYIKNRVSITGSKKAAAKKQRFDKVQPGKAFTYQGKTYWKASRTRACLQKDMKRIRPDEEVEAIT